MATIDAGAQPSDTTREDVDDANRSALAWLWPYWDRLDECPGAPHRGPQGPNEDLGQCGQCGMPSWSLRNPGETFGEHLPDCSLPLRHESFCQPGGAGHPPSWKVRG